MSLKDYTNISKAQTIDAGMAVSLILLLIGVFTGNLLFYKLTLPALLINMTVPKAYYPFAILWFALSEFMASIMSKVILFIVFLLVVFPIGLFRRILGKDNLSLKKFKKSTASVLTDRNITYKSTDLDHPF